MKAVTKFEADDGTIFDTEKAAMAHDRLCCIRKWYASHMLYGNYEGSRIEWEDFLEWCAQHKRELKEIIEIC